MQQLSGAGGGRAVFTQPPMPIKCAGAPQKAMYLSADQWRRDGVLSRVDIQFCNAGAVLFGVPDYVPALMEYVGRYGIHLNFGQTLVSVDGAARRATFRRALADGGSELVTREFDMLHVVPPQKAPDFIRASQLADAAGWVEVDPATLRHPRYENVFALGDAGNTSNAKTAAAARKQAPVVAHNVLALRGRAGRGALRRLRFLPADGGARQGGAGRVPVRRQGRPSLPRWLLDGTRPTRAARLLRSASCRRSTGTACSRAVNGWRSRPSAPERYPGSRRAPVGPGGPCPGAGEAAEYVPKTNQQNRPPRREAGRQDRRRDGKPGPGRHQRGRRSRCGCTLRPGRATRSGSRAAGAGMSPA